MVAIRKCDFEPSVGECNDKSFGFLTETLGYVPIKRQVESFFQATGGQFFSGRDEEYDFPGSVEDPQDDRAFDIREMELSEIGALMANTPNVKLEATTESAAKADELVSSEGAKEPEAEAPKES